MKYDQFSYEKALESGEYDFTGADLRGVSFLFPRIDSVESRKITTLIFDKAKLSKESVKEFVQDGVRLDASTFPNLGLLSMRSVDLSSSKLHPKAIEHSSRCHFDLTRAKIRWPNGSVEATGKRRDRSVKLHDSFWDEMQKLIIESKRKDITDEEVEGLLVDLGRLTINHPYMTHQLYITFEDGELRDFTEGVSDEIKDSFKKISSQYKGLARRLKNFFGGGRDYARYRTANELLIEIKSSLELLKKDMS